MQDSLYPLNLKDVEAIGRSRAKRSLPNNIKWWLYGGLGVCIAGFLYGAMGGNGWFVVGIVAMGAILVWYSAILTDRIQKRVVRQLKRELKESNRE